MFGRLPDDGLAHPKACSGVSDDGLADSRERVEWVLEHMGFVFTNKNVYSSSVDNTSSEDTPPKMDESDESPVEVLTTGNEGAGRESGSMIQPGQLLADVNDAIQTKLDKLRSEGDLKCYCKSDNGGPTCVNDECCFKKNKIECPSTCQTTCDNKRSTGPDVGRNLRFKCTDQYGVCVVPLKDVSAGTLLVEYTGLVTRGNVHRNQLHAFPILKFKVEGGVYIDSEVFGNQSRYLKHSSNDPNCVVEEWIVDNHVRLFVTAIRNIAKGDPLTVCFPQSVDDSYQVLTEAEREERKQDRKKSNRSYLNFTGKYRKTESFLKVKGRYKCDYGTCQASYEVLAELVHHKISYHAAAVPICDVDKKDLYEKPKETREEKLRNAPAELKFKYEDPVGRDILVYRPGIEKEYGDLLRDVGGRLKRLRDEQEEEEAARKEVHAKRIALMKKSE